MNKIFQRVGTLAVAMAVILPAIPALASAPTFSVAAPNSGQSPDIFREQVQIYNSHFIDELVHAKTVQVVPFDRAWSDPGDLQKAFDAVEISDQSIHLLREGLKANPAAAKLLAEHKIVLNTVVDIVPTGTDLVQIYVE